jgi:glutathione-regulated potassium-efflux system ancillary protein KefC
MTQMYAIAAVWLALAIFSTALANRIKVPVALTEICVGMAAGFVCERWLPPGILGVDEGWLRFLAGAGAVLLTFLAGAELEPTVLRSKAREVLVVGAVGFVAPFLGCAAVARDLPR